MSFSNFWKNERMTQARKDDQEAVVSWWSWAINCCMIRSYCVSVTVAPPPSSIPPRTPILRGYAFLNPPLPLGIPISPPHQPHLLHYSWDSSNPPLSPDLMIPPRLSPPLPPPRSPLSSGRWGGGHTDLPQDCDNILLHHPLPHYSLPPIVQIIHEISRHHRWFSGSWLPTLKVLLFQKGVRVLQGLHPSWHRLRPRPARIPRNSLAPTPTMYPQTSFILLVAICNCTMSFVNFSSLLLCGCLFGV